MSLNRFLEDLLVLGQQHLAAPDPRTFSPSGWQSTTAFAAAFVAVFQDRGERVVVWSQPVAVANRELWLVFV